MLFEDVHDISNALLSLQLQRTPIAIESSVSKPIVAKHSVLLGSYPQGNADGTASPIKWLVITTKENQSLLMSKGILDFKPYDYNLDGETALWEGSSLRHWLNEEFYENAFSEDEKQNILPIQLGDESSEADSVFLLSIDDAKKYLDDQALKTGVWWWLRNSDSNTHTVAYVNSEGYFFTGHTILTVKGGVRPCIWVKNKPI